MSRWRYVAGSMGCLLLLFALAMVLAAQPSFAQDIDVSMGEGGGTHRSIFGLGVGYAPDYEGSDDYMAVPLIQARVNWQHGYFVSLLGNTLRANLVPNRNWHFGPVVRYRMERDDVDDNRVDNMKKVDAAVELGVFGAYSDEHWLMRVAVLEDAADGHDGSLMELGLGYKVPLQQRGVLTLFATSTYADSDYMDAYFGVSSSDAKASGLSTYDADSGFKDFSIGLAWQHNFDDKWGMLTLAKFTQLLDDAKDSPVVDDAGDENQALVGVVVNYRFGN